MSSQVLHILVKMTILYNLPTQFGYLWLKILKLNFLKVSTRFWSPNLDHEFSLFNGIYNLILQFHLTFLRSKNFRICLCELSNSRYFQKFLAFSTNLKRFRDRTIYSTKFRKLRIQVKDRIDCFFPRSCLHEFSEEDAFFRVKCWNLTVLRKAFSKTL